MFNEDDIGRRLRTFMDREIADSRPASLDLVQTRGSHGRRLKQFAIVAVVVSLLVVMGAMLAVVAHRPGREEVSTQYNSRVRIVILPGSGSKWVAFAVRNNMTTNVTYGVVGAVDRRSGSSWRQVDYFASSNIGGTRPGSLSHDPPSAVLAIALIAPRGALGAVQWIDVSSLSPGAYRLRQTVDWGGESSPSTGKPRRQHAVAIGEFLIDDGGEAQAPRDESVARIEADPPVVNGAPMSLALALVGGTGDLASDIKIEESVSLTVHVRRWEHGEWVEIATRQAVRVRDITSTVSLPRLVPGLYQLARAKPSGGEIDGWLFVTNGVEPLDNAATSKRCSASSAVSADIDADGRRDRVYLVWSGSSARLGVCTTTGRTDEVDCPGQAQNLLVVTMPNPQPTVILCGGSSVGEVGFMPYVWNAGALHQAPLPNPNQTAFGSGRTGPGFSNFAQFGCPYIGGERMVAQLTLEPRGSAWTWTRRAYAITATGARLANTSTGTVPAPLTQRSVDSLAPACGGISPSGEEPRITIGP
jgi:hypothetical protein